jgi:tRNA(fMet)-specific endonuclease VapC
VIRKLQEFEVSEIGISSITLSELEYGVSKSVRPEQNKWALAEFLAPIQVLAYDDQAADAYGKIRACLERQGTPLGPLDTLIGAHARSLGCRLVTNNTKEFARIPDLLTEDWTRELKIED